VPHAAVLPAPVEDARGTVLRPAPRGEIVLADGTSYVRETIFDGRYNLVSELNKLGAKVEVAGNAVLVHGPATLKGASVIALM